MGRGNQMWTVPPSATQEKLDVSGEIKDSLPCSCNGRARGLRCNTEGERVFSTSTPALQLWGGERQRGREREWESEEGTCLCFGVFCLISHLGWKGTTYPDADRTVAWPRQKPKGPGQSAARLLKVVTKFSMRQLISQCPSNLAGASSYRIQEAFHFLNRKCMFLRKCMVQDKLSSS